MSATEVTEVEVNQSVSQSVNNDKQTERILKIGSLIVLLLIVAFVWAMEDGRQKRNQKIDALKVAGQKSPAHQFVVDKYLSCERESFISSKDECIARVLVLARARGAEYETRVGAAIQELGLDK